MKEILNGLTDEQKEKAKAYVTMDELTACLGELGVALPDSQRLKKGRRSTMSDNSRSFSGLGGRLTLMPDGTLYGVGWDLAIPYGVDYDPAAALAAPPVKLAEDVISAAAGYNYGLYVTADAALHFLGSSGVPYAEYFAFDGTIREVFTEPDRDMFRLTDEAGDTYVWGDNYSGLLQKLALTPRAVLDGQTLASRRGKAVYRYSLNGTEYRCKGLLLEHAAWEIRGELHRQISESEEYRRLSAEYGENNLLCKYIQREVSPDRDIQSENWSEADYESLKEGPAAVPRYPGVRNLRVEAYCGKERDFRYTVGIYTVNRVLFRPIKIEKET